MDLIAVIIIGVIVTTTGILNPDSKDVEEVAQTPKPQVSTPAPEPKKEEPKK